MRAYLTDDHPCYNIIRNSRGMWEHSDGRFDFSNFWQSSSVDI